MRTTEQPWTTSRCNRLLRPISSRIATLRKEIELQQTAGEPRKPPSNALYAGNNTGQPRPRKPQSFDPEWVPAGKVPSKRTYGRGSRRTNPPSALPTVQGTQPGQIAATPFIARSRIPLLDSPDLHNTPLRRRSKGPLIAKVQKIKDLKKQVSPDIGKLIEGLLDAYAKLLEATCPSVLKSRTGARSLMSTCLQNMPRYIALEEHFAELDAEEADEVRGRDLTDEIYTHLEQTFAVGEGWTHFKEMVRAHGTSLICDAIDDGLLGLDVLHAVVELCMKASAWQEAERFLWTYLPLLKPLPTPSTLDADLFGDTSVYMHLVMALVKSTGRNGFLFDLLEHLIFYDLLPLEWLASGRMKQVVWWRLERTLSNGDERTFGHAVRFLQTAILATMGLSDDTMTHEDVGSLLKPSVRQTLRDALDNTISNMLTLLASSALACRNDDEQDSTSRRLTWVLDYIVTGLLARDEFRANLELLDATDQDMQTFALRALWTVSASLMVHLGGCSLGPGLHYLESATLLHSFRWIIHQYSCSDIDVHSLLTTLPPFISSIARFAGKVRKTDGFDHLHDLITALLSHSSIRLPHKLWNVQRLALETCQEFAQSSNDSAHFAYARQVEGLMSKMGKVMLVQSPGKNDSPEARRGWRLEEGIGEWVACTPFAKKDDRSGRRQCRGARDGRTHLPSPASSVSTQSGEGVDEDARMRGRTAKRFTTTNSKRPRASSPTVVIPYKKVCLTPDSAASSSSRHDPLISYSGTSEQHSPVSGNDKGLRRSGRTKTQRKEGESRSSHHSLRKVAPKNYAEAGEEEDHDGGEVGPQSGSESNVQHAGAATDAEESDNDELGKTPARLQRSTGTAAKRGPTRRAGTTQLPCVKKGTETRRRRSTRLRTWSLLVAKKHFEESESEDELRFC
ncbi:uncharacterized protein EI97DRAFT_434289 [Westerdykella ornata]|uniref:Uncharacterized protein n=1 Tax=Westerdykella ornata TaxID=318751 RepID=A0A6A6JGH8_WESOR|nr:uncharacterized protein EI97DRAFT_434289 [Westerdykella ornata]KAF2275447.1 hypothetical protein EI97DRAFT_434289 [Westerdykella ornata]